MCIDLDVYEEIKERVSCSISQKEKKSLFSCF